ncbi:tail collar protein [Pedobacter kyungheensis]|uniref:Tail collar protein n=1 Tax=Pedobacter kyungheensis TaxID=1069985 RepID=A0A0C1FT96_9SPHI|nr:tail fiber protein [Pedobacter kyungheensis]KIA96127.1 tail collar protein [Pedobacter kyungheensis]
MATPYVGEIRMFGGNFAPAGWALCSGQLLSIAENDVLYNLIGTTYGGDGQTTFGLPNLNGRVPVHMGTSSGVTYTIGQMAGVESVTLTVNQMPAHQHTINGELTLMTRGDSSGNFSSPDNHAIGIAPLKKFFSKTSSGLKMAPLASTTSLAPQGGSQPHNNMQPYLAINFIISLFGVYPTSN